MLFREVLDTFRVLGFVDAELLESGKACNGRPFDRRPDVRAASLLERPARGAPRGEGHLRGREDPPRSRRSACVTAGGGVEVDPPGASLVFFKNFLKERAPEFIYTVYLISHLHGGTQWLLACANLLSR